MNRFPLALAVFCGLVISAHAQSFSSGSTGADGALDLSTMNCPNDPVCFVQLPESGILNYTTVSVPSGKTLKFKSNSRNTPVVLLAQGNVTISGEVRLDASGNTPGPGGFYGGQLGSPGFGPGGGTLSAPQGRWIGPLSLVPIVGGSGGAAVSGGCCGPGGGGGGAIVIASSTSITFTGLLSALGQINNGVGVGFGSGGAIRLVANSLNVSGQFSACSGGCGVVRLEAPSGALTFTGGSQPPAGLFPINPTLGVSALPVLRIVAIGGFPVPSYAGSRFDTYDMLLPNQLPDPISVDVEGTNLPPGTQVTVGVVNHTGPTSTSGTLTGTFQFSTATATISGLNRGAVTYLLATAIFDPPAGAMVFNPKGQNHVAKIRVDASPGAKQKFFFLRRNGTEVNQVKLPKQFLAQLGL